MKPARAQPAASTAATPGEARVRAPGNVGTSPAAVVPAAPAAGAMSAPARGTVYPVPVQTAPRDAARTNAPPAAADGRANVHADAPRSVPVPPSTTPSRDAGIAMPPPRGDARALRSGAAIRACTRCNGPDARATCRAGAACAHRHPAAPRCGSAGPFTAGSGTRAGGSGGSGRKSTRACAAFGRCEGRAGARVRHDAGRHGTLGGLAMQNAGNSRRFARRPMLDQFAISARRLPPSTSLTRSFSWTVGWLEYVNVRVLPASILIDTAQ